MFSDFKKRPTALGDVMQSLDDSNQIQAIKTVGNQRRPASTSPNYINSSNARTTSMPSHVQNVRTLVTHSSDVSSKVSVMFSRDPADRFYAKGVVYVSNYKGNPSPVQIASGHSPVSFALENTGEPVSVTVQAHGNLGPAPLETAPNTTLQLRSTGLATLSTPGGTGPGGGGPIADSVSFFTGEQYAQIQSTNVGPGGFNNDVYAYEIYIPTARTITRISAQTGSTPGAGKSTMGLYSKDGLTQYFTAGANAFDDATLTLQTVTIGSVTIQSGYYYLAYGLTDSSHTFKWGFAFTDTNALNLNGSLRGVKCGNSLSSGTMPATLGSFTASAHTGQVAYLLQP
jgi:hypothetical protein